MLQKAKIVFVDDEIGMQQIFRIFFKKEVREGQYEISYLSSAEECLEYLRQVMDDRLIVLTDINMPGMDGYSLLGQIKKEFPRVRVVMVSAYSSQEFIDRAIAMGADAYFTKPIEVGSIKAKIAEIQGQN